MGRPPSWWAALGAHTSLSWRCDAERVVTRLQETGLDRFTQKRNEEKRSTTKRRLVANLYQSALTSEVRPLIKEQALLHKTNGQKECTPRTTIRKRYDSKKELILHDLSPFQHDHINDNDDDDTAPTTAAAQGRIS
eukprot:scaffold111_cov149-Amphora_coffeaeformis.AAC.4